MVEGHDIRSDAVGLPPARLAILVGVDDDGTVQVDKESRIGSLGAPLFDRPPIDIVLHFRVTEANVIEYHAVDNV